MLFSLSKVSFFPLSLGAAGGGGGGRKEGSGNGRERSFANDGGNGTVWFASIG